MYAAINNMRAGLRVSPCLLFRCFPNINIGMTIISASRRTDIPAFYGDWFIDKINRGECHVVNPFNGKVDVVSLKPSDVDGFVFWSRNYAPMLKNLKRLHGMDYRFYCQLTINCYPRFIDPASPSLEKSARMAHALREAFGPRAVVWRYDPIMITSATPVDWHIENFSKIASALKGFTDTCVISFIDWYKKLDRNLLPVLEKNGVSYGHPSMVQLQNIANVFTQIAAASGVKTEGCCEPDSNLPPTACIDPVRLADITGKDFSKIARVPSRKSCNCAASKDIGAYDSCIMGCACCYANRSRQYSLKRRNSIASTDMAL